MKTPIDILEQAKCGTVILEYPSIDAALKMYEDLCHTAFTNGGDYVISLDSNRIVITQA